MQKEIKIQTEIAQQINGDIAWHYSIVPQNISDSIVYFYTYPDNAQHIQEELEVLFGKQVKFEYREKNIIIKALNTYYRRAGTENAAQGNISNFQTDEAVYLLIQEAAAIDSSDIHIEPFEHKFRIRFRIDGKLIERYLIDKDNYPFFLNKLKLASNLDIAERRLPQDGRISYNRDDKKFDVRVSVLPTMFGEKAVLRLLNNEVANFSLQDLGFAENQHKIYSEAIKKPHGMILISGPTGSGKTTTLYATLKILNQTDVNIVTIEDPIEYTLEGINQVQLNDQIGLNFTKALRTFLRQDPDIIMLGEIRDVDTAQLAIRASLTGHLILSTIHTNSAIDTISRLVDMGLPPYLVASTLNISLAQRLVRLLCPHCKTEHPTEKGMFPSKFAPDEIPDTHYQPQGCEKCFFTGYSGRKALYEIVVINDSMKDLMKKGDINEMKKQVDNPLSDKAFQIFKKGESSIQEIYPLLLT